ncbi:RmlC-like cupin [Cenococcum geophilum 1.58]|uniref:RmlC-like cupin n=1 Tax=Cenococcum geophilum 1.58 TaxID=794803 RepID=UPI00358F6450|nr:RmlC-like cupin [Cenococcum geophilum 1.58]
MVEKVLQLKCNCNQYPWGRKGSESLAARLCAKTLGEDLQDVLDAHPQELIGKTVTEIKYTKLPYLSKVLSAAKALPLHLHPNKNVASELHRRDPSNFTNSNHKPEIALALTECEAFRDFKPPAAIDRLTKLPPLQVSPPQVKKPEFNDQTLKYIAKRMLEASDEVI